MSLSLSETDLVSDMYVGLSFPTYKMGLILVLTSQGCHAVMPLNAQCYCHSPVKAGCPSLSSHSPKHHPCPPADFVLGSAQE